MATPRRAQFTQKKPGFVAIAKTRFLAHTVTTSNVTLLCP